MGLTLRQLGYFVALAEEGHFGRAAERVHVTQPALSMQIRDMEDRLGVALVDRLPRAVRLTPMGRAVEARARRILSEVADLEALARTEGLRGPVNLGIIPTLAPYLLPVALPHLRAADITRDLRLREATTEALLAGLERGQLDAVVIAAGAEVAGLAAQRLFEDRFLIAGSASRLAALPEGAEGLRPRLLDPGQLLLLDEGHCLADQALEVCGLDRRSARLDLGASSLATLSGLVAQGLGLTFLPEVALAQERAASPGLAVRRFAAPEPARTIVLARRSGSAAQGWFSELATVLERAGRQLVGEARAVVPPA
ncbi:MAG: LysR substrate-binding domain-containing protein [Gemmobacter sp.]